MHWFIPALLSPIVYSLINFVDKYLISSEIKDYRAMPIYTGIVGFIGGTLLWIFTGFPILEFRDAFIILLTGVLALFALVFYFQALSEEETTVIIILFQMFPVFSLILSYLFLSETITLKQLIGFIIILTASVGVSLRKTSTKTKIGKALLLITIYNILWAFSGVLAKYTINVNTLPKIFSYESWGIGFGGLILFLFYIPARNAFLENVKTIKKRTLAILFINEGLFALGKSLSFLAYSLGSVALVSVVSSTQVFFGIILGFVLTLIAPKVFKEDVTKEGLLKKIAFSILLFIGILLVY